MKLQQLRYIVEVFNHALNVSMAAKTLCTSQPSMSKQIRQLEDSLGVQIFERHGKHFTRVTPAGKELVRMAREILTEVDNAEAVACEQTHPEQGILTISPTNNQLRYQLPLMICSFRRQYPQVVVQTGDGSSLHTVEAMTKGKIDFTITAEMGSLYDDILMLPCYHWQLVVVVHREHPLALKKQISEAELTHYPLVTYPLSFWGRTILSPLFCRTELASKVIFTATDSELLKVYVRLGLGVGIIAKMALHPQLDSDLISLDATAFLPMNTTKIGFLRGKFLRNYMLDFIAYFAPHLTRSVIDAAAALTDNQAVDEMFNAFKLPLK